MEKFINRLIEQISLNGNSEQFILTLPFKLFNDESPNFSICIIKHIDGYYLINDQGYTLKYLNNLDIQGIKIHMLSILKNTALADMYEKEHFNLITRDEYINIVCDQLEYLRPEIVIHRITGDPKISDLIEPDWLIKKVTILNDIDKEMVRRNSYQGIKHNKKD